MSDEITFKQFVELFAGNTSAYGSEQGSCVHSTLTADGYRMHLTGDEPIGVYPLVHQDGEWLVHWGCVDLDVKASHKRRWDYDSQDEAFVAARNLRMALAVLGMDSFIESTKSGGYHVWLFASEWVPAASMRRALLVACGLAEVPPTEVNPKSEGFADPTSLGNYVRLPYPSWEQGVVSRPIVDDEHQYLPLPEFVDMAYQTRVGADLLAQTALLWRPEGPQGASYEAVGTRVPTIAGTLSRRLQAVIKNGPLRQEDRSGWLYYVARLCNDDGISEPEAVQIVTDCDSIHTHKFTNREDGHRQIERTVRRAYS
jgi:hypothetical protein